MINYYTFLGLNDTGLNHQSAPYTLKEISRAHKRKALKYHPDKNSDGTDEFKRIQQGQITSDFKLN